MTVPALHAALARVEAHIASATCSVALSGLLQVRASIKDQIATHGGSDDRH